MIHITGTIAINEKEIKEEFIRSSGPGGQNVNKVATAVQLRFDVRSSPSLPADVRERLVRLAGSRITEEGVLIIDARRFRSREQNRRDAIGRLKDLIARAAERPRLRRKTRLPRAAKMRRLETKRLRGRTKCQRQAVRHSED
jgi:ribosome-associated protein